MAPKDANPEYWEQYSNFQYVKHQLVREYLGGWFPILGSWNGRVLYFDTHAGRGTHVSGHLGSPLVALRTLLDHRNLTRLLKSCEFRFNLIEIDEENKQLLDEEIASFGELPAKIHVKTTCAECFELLQSLVATLRESRQKMAPAFVFVDPYGFKIPGSVLRDLMAAGRVELFVNVIWRELDMAIAQARQGNAGLASTMDVVFDGRAWLDRIISADFDERADQAVDLLAEVVSAKWATPIRMLGDNGKTRYILVHFSKHDAGRKLMKECMWKVCPEADGYFFARKGNQLILLTNELDLEPLSEWVMNQIGSRGIRWKELHKRVLAEIWREKHVNDVVRKLRKSRLIDARDFIGTCTPKNNPRLVRTSS